MIEDAIRDAATLLVAKLGEEIAAIHELTEAVKAGGTSGGGTTPPSTDKLFTVHQVIEKDNNINRKVVVTKVPDDNDTNKDTIWMGSKPQEIKVYSRWQDVPASLVYWKDLDEIHKMNTYDEWACAVSTWMYNANGVRIPFPEIYIAGGTERARYYWLHRSCLGSVLRYE